MKQTSNSSLFSKFFPRNRDDYQLDFFSIRPVTYIFLDTTSGGFIFRLSKKVMTLLQIWSKKIWSQKSHNPISSYPEKPEKSHDPEPDKHWSLPYISTALLLSFLEHTHTCCYCHLIYLTPFNFRPPLIFGRGWPKIRGTEKV